MKNNRILSILPALALLFAVGCDRSAPAKSTADAASPSTTAASSKAGPTDGRAIEIGANDAMKFDVTEIHATPGEALAVTLHNNGTMPKFSMGHNWVLLAADVDIDAFAEATGMAAKTDYIPDSFTGQIIAHTKLLGPKESDTVHFYAPKTPGTYAYICSFPGHLQVGMKGVLIVK